MHGKPSTPRTARAARARQRRGLEQAVVARATGQHGLVSTPQLLEIGLSRDSIDGWRKTSRLFVVHRGVYKLGPSPLTRRGELMAAALACGPSSLISHRSAAALWGLRRWPGGPAEVLLPNHVRRSRTGIAIHRSRDLPPPDRTRRDGIPVTSVPRTLIDLAGVVDADGLRRAVEEADRLGLLRLAALTGACERANGRRGVGALRSILADYRDAPATLSPLEDRFADFCRDYGIELPEMNVTLAGWRVDAHWPGTRLAVELDSWEFHSARGQFDRDRLKGLALQDADYELVRLSAPQLEHPQAADTAAALRRRLSAVA